MDLPPEGIVDVPPTLVLPAHPALAGQRHEFVGRVGIVLGGVVRGVSVSSSAHKQGDHKLTRYE